MPVDPALVRTGRTVLAVSSPSLPKGRVIWLCDHRLVPVMAHTLRVDSVLPAFISPAPGSQTSYETGYLGLPPSEWGAVIWTTQQRCVLKAVLE